MASSPQVVLCRYHYDPLDRLAGATSLGQPDTLRFYQTNRLATQIQGAVQQTIIQHDDLLLAQQQRSDSAFETTLLATDQQRSVLQLLDNPGTRSLIYSPYGHHPGESGISSLLGFNGEHRDSVTGYYLLGNGYRAFNPVLMRLNSPDSLSPFDEGGINAYAYCEGDPVNSLDPSGHIPFRTFTFPNRSFYGSAYSVRRLPSRLLSKGRDVTQLTGKVNRVSPRQSVDGRRQNSAAEVSVIQHTSSITATSPGVKLVAGSSSAALSGAPPGSISSLANTESSGLLEPRLLKVNRQFLRGGVDVALARTGTLSIARMKAHASAVKRARDNIRHHEELLKRDPDNRKHIRELRKDRGYLVQSETRFMDYQGKHDAKYGWRNDWHSSSFL